MPKHKLQKFVRSESTLGHLRIQHRDIALLQNLASFRFLNSAQIMALHPGGKRNLQRRLHRLYHLGYVERPEAQRDIELSSNNLVYALGKKGAEVAFGEERAVKNWSRLNARIKSPNLAHALMISQFRIVLSLALPHTIKISRWSQGYELRDLLKIKGQTPSLVPDAFFVLEKADGQWFFFLEADRSTMPSYRVLEKLKNYWELYRNKTYEKTLNMPYFRVLTITENKGRRDNLCRAAKEADTRKTGSNLFIFACEKDYSLKNPEAVLAPIWLSAKDGEPHKMLE